MRDTAAIILILAGTRTVNRIRLLDRQNQLVEFLPVLCNLVRFDKVVG